MDNETLVMFGGEIKSIGENRIGGYLVLFGDSKKTDLVGDFFTKSTDFGPHTLSPVLYDHGMDGVLKRRVLDDKAEMKLDDIGIWIEAQLYARDDYEKAIINLVGQKKLGWSSGTASHLVERKAMGNAFHITRWPLGLDASLTPTPAESRTKAVSLKSLYTETKSSLLTGLDFDEHSDTVLTACHEFAKRAGLLIDRRKRDGKSISTERLDSLKRVRDEFTGLVEAATLRDVRIDDLKRSLIQNEAALYAALAGVRNEFESTSREG